MRTPYQLFRSAHSPFWYVYFIDRQGRRVRRSTKETDEKRAHAVARELERRFADPTHTAANATTLADAAVQLIDHLEQKGRAPMTRLFYTKKLRHVSRLLGAETPLADITAPTVDGFIKQRRVEGAKRYTIAKELTALRMALKVARRLGQFDKEISQVMPVGYARGYMPKTRRVTIEEAWAIIALVPPEAGRYVAFVCATTARDSAVWRARGFDLLPGSGLIRVRDRKTNASSRDVPLTSITSAFARHAFNGVGPEGFVTTKAGSLHETLFRACKALSIPRVSPNDLRRSVAHWLLGAGAPRGVVAAFMGHTSTKMLDEVYGRLDAGEIGQALARSMSDSSPPPSAA